MYDELIGDLYLVASCVQSKNRRELLQRAADAIEELILTAESYKRSMEAWADVAANAQPRWIQVSERLPSAHELVLVYNPGYLMSTGFMYKDGRWRVRSVDYPETPTHWMPLPEPPKED